jgi:hypothetical protein
MLDPAVRLAEASLVAATRAVSWATVIAVLLAIGYIVWLAGWSAWNERPQYMSPRWVERHHRKRQP